LNPALIGTGDSSQATTMRQDPAKLLQGGSTSHHIDLRSARILYVG